jgi:glycosyltransferase involved in cell wall biosynthesis
MILFLNFVPIEFMGGTEKWMHYTAKKIDAYEDTQMISLHRNIANIYGQLVLKRKYDSRTRGSKIHHHISLGLKAFIPFTKQWKNTRKVFLSARLIYTRYELLEFFLVLYFSGMSGFKKTIAGLHSPFIYRDPISFFDRLHNAIYSSWIYTCIFQQIRRVHVLNIKDEKYLRNVCKLKNVAYVPNGVAIPKIKKEKIMSNIDTLKILFIGELSLRKGVDVLLEIIKKAPKHIRFTIAGDGHLRKDLVAVAKKFSNVQYQGYSDNRKLATLYRQNEAIILPSRAESMSLALLEAMSYGLVIINSTDTMLGLDRRVEYSCENKNITTYLDTLKKLFTMKITNKLNKDYVRDYFNHNFSSDIIDIKLYKKIFEINKI